MNFQHTLIKAKEALPYNGDWIYVTLQTPSSDITQSDSVPKLTETKDVSSEMRSESNIEVLKVIYERAKSYENSVYASADHVRDKAKTLLGTATFVSAIIFGVAALYVNSISKSNSWIIVAESILFFLLISHMLRALSAAVNVMTREVAIKQSAFELLRSNGDSIDYYKENIAQIIAYANQTHLNLNSRVNDLILAQCSYRYGLKFFVLIIYVHLMNVFLLPSDVDPNNRKLISSKVASVCDSLQGIKSEIRGLNANVVKLSQEVQKLHLPKK